MIFYSKISESFSQQQDKSEKEKVEMIQKQNLKDQIVNKIFENFSNEQLNFIINQTLRPRTRILKTS